MHPSVSTFRNPSLYLILMLTLFLLKLLLLSNQMATGNLRPTVSQLQAHFSFLMLPEKSPRPGSWGHRMGLKFHPQGVALIPMPIPGRVGELVSNQ